MAGIFAYVFFVENKRPNVAEAKERGERVAQIDRDKVNKIVIKNSEAKIELERKEGSWFLNEPIKDRADSTVINQLFTTAESLKHDAVIGDDGKGVSKDKLKEFGLTNSDTKLTLSGDEKPVELTIGKDSAVEGKVYAKLESSGAVYVISNELKNQLSKKPDDFRDHRLTEVNVAQVKKATFKSSAGEIEVVKKDGHWTLLKPMKARGEDSKIGDLISQATTAHIESFVGDSTNLAAFGLQEPRGTVSLSLEDAKEPVVLQIGANPKDDKEKDKTYAKLSTRESVVELPKTIETLLTVKPNDLRDKNLVRVESDIVDRITIEPAGGTKIVLARKGEDWVRKGEKDTAANGALAAGLLSTLKTQQVVEFVADIGTDLPKYGLDQPQVKLTLSSFASENTAEEKAGEKPIVTVLFGKEEGGSVYAKLDDEPFIVKVDRAILEAIPTNAIRWQSLEIFKVKPEEVTSIEVTKSGQAPVALEREKDVWKLAKGDGAVNQTNAKSLVNTLAGLRAVRWIGPTKPEDGFDKPALVVSFKAGATAGKLTLGAPSPEEMTLATVEGVVGTLVVNGPDKSALELPLVDKPAVAAPAPTAIPPAAPMPVAPSAPAPPAPVSTPPVPAPVPDDVPPKPEAPATEPAKP